MQSLPDCTEEYAETIVQTSLSYLKGLSPLLLKTLGHSHLELTLATVHLIVEETGADPMNLPLFQPCDPSTLYAKEEYTLTTKIIATTVISF